MMGRFGLRSRRKARVGLCAFYSDSGYEELAQRNIVAPLKAGRFKGVDRLFLYTADDLDEQFRARHKGILRHKRGYGYWCWKPHVILKALGELAEGDYLCYSDVDIGIRYFFKPGRAARILRRLGQDFVAVPKQGEKEGKWTKRDVLIALGCDSPEYTGTDQVQALLLLMRKTRFVMDLLHEWERLCSDEHMISDSPSKAPNPPEFVEHRHDQSLLSLLYKRRGLKVPATHNELRDAADLLPALSGYRRGWRLGTRWRLLKARLRSRAGAAE